MILPKILEAVNFCQRRHPELSFEIEEKDGAVHIELTLFEGRSRLEPSQDEPRILIVLTPSAPKRMLTALCSGEARKPLLSVGLEGLRSLSLLVRGAEDLVNLLEFVL